MCNLEWCTRKYYKIQLVSRLRRNSLQFHVKWNHHHLILKTKQIQVVEKNAPYLIIWSFVNLSTTIIPLMIFSSFWKFSAMNVDQPSFTFSEWQFFTGFWISPTMTNMYLDKVNNAFLNISALAFASSVWQHSSRACKQHSSIKNSLLIYVGTVTFSGTLIYLTCLHTLLYEHLVFRYSFVSHILLALVARSLSLQAFPIELKPPRATSLL